MGDEFQDRSSRTFPLHRLPRVCNFPVPYLGLGLDDMVVHHQGYAASIDLVRALGAQLLTSGASAFSAIIKGPFGSGKTRLACWLLEQAARAKWLGLLPHPTQVGTSPWPMFVEGSYLVDLRFDNKDNSDTRQRVLGGAAFVVLDDPFRSSGNRGHDTWVEGIIEMRWMRGLHTVVTRNLNKDSKSDRFEDFLKNFAQVILSTEGSMRGRDG